MKPAIVNGVGAAVVSICLACSSTQSGERTSGAAPTARHVADGCNRAEESLRYGDFVGGQALATLAWTGMPEDASDLKIPVYVVGVEGPPPAAQAIGV